MDGYVEKSQFDALQQSYDQLKQELDQLKRLVHGIKSERLVSQDLPGQMSLALEGIVEVPAEVPVNEMITYSRQKKQGPVSRHPLPEHLLRVQYIVEPEEDVTGLKSIGEEMTEVLAKQPSRLYVIQIICRKYAKADGNGVIIARMPSRAIEKGLAHESLLADILVSKYVDHLPLYQQAKILTGEGVKVASSTMSDWVRACCRLLEPLYEALIKEINLNDYLQADESPIKVLDKDKKGSTHRGYYWLYHIVGTRLVLFEYQKGLGREGPPKLLKKYKGYLQTDGYGLYDKFEKNPDIALLGCMAHARRYFEQARDNDRPRADYFLQSVRQLYVVEEALRDQEADWGHRLEVRKKIAIPILKQLGQWLQVQSTQVLPKSTIGKAVHYSLKHWDKLCRYAGHGGLEIDNSLIENQVRPLALGRKNYLLAESNEAARDAAIIYSLVGSCQLNKLDPYKYLYSILTKIPDYPINQIADLLPCNVSFEKPEV